MEPEAMTFLIVGSASSNVTAIQTALTAQGNSSVLTTTTAFNGLSVSTLLGYAGVIWTTALGPTSTSLPNMQAYLDAGGKLLVFYNDFGYGWRTTATPNFFTTYFEGQYAADAGSLGALTGVDIMAGVNPSVATDPYPDSFTLIGPDAVGIFANNAPNTDWAAWRVSRSGYKAVIAGFLLNYASPASTQTSIVQNAVTWLAPMAVITPTAGANGSITPNTPQMINYGASQLFSIAANAGYHIADVGVDGSSVGAVSVYTFTNVTVNHTITATFAPNPVNLTVNVIGNGLVTKVPDHAYSYGDVVTLTANAATNWAFAGWSGDLSGTANPTTITLAGDKVVTATFVSTCVPVNGVDFTYLPAAPKVNKIVTFNGTALTGTTPITYSWNFGDGSAVGSGTPITHFFPITLTTHSYTVTLTAANACGTVPALKSLTVQPQTAFLPIVLRQ
jgi:hypothetical protein